MASFGQLGSGISTGFQEIGGGAGGLIQIAVSDYTGGVLGIGSKIYTLGVAIKNLATSDSWSSAGKNLLALGNQVVPNFAAHGGPGWGNAEWGNLTYQDSTNHWHDDHYPNVAGASMQWAMDQLKPVPLNKVGSGPLGIAYSLLGIPVFAAIDGFRLPHN